MRATTAAAAAVLLGSVMADDWESWSSSSTDATTPVADTTWSKPTDPSTWTATPDATTDSNTWGTWDSTTTTSSSADPTTWSEWSTTSSTPAAKTSTWTDPDSTWSEWSSTSSSADPTTWSEWSSTSTSVDPSSWSEWSSTTSADPSTTWAAWSSSSSADPSTTWSEWSSSSQPDGSTSTWSAWDPTATVTSTSTQWITVTVYPVDGSSSTWSEWSSDAATTTTNTNTVVVSSTITKTGTWADWSASASATPVAAFDPMCKLEISISYGAPVWYPTPVIATSANSTAWGEWDGASSTPAASTSTSSDYTWAVWTASSSSSASASTDPSTWSEWDGSSSTSVSATSSSASGTWSAWDGSSTPAASTSTAASSSWANWGSSASQTQGGAFYSASATGSWGSKSSGSSNSGSWSTGAMGISSNGNKFGMTYSPYTANGGCKDQGTVNADIAEIASKGFTSVRVYSTDCSTLEFVGGAAKSNGIKVILGVFISDTGISGAQPQVDAIVAWAQWDIVELIVVGNEAVFNNQCTASELAGFIGSSKSAFQGAGYKGAVSTTDELSVWQGQGSAWCDVVDVVSANLYAFFNPNTAAEDAGSFIQAQIQDLSSVCPGKEVYVMESGWPSAGECNGAACPSPENQATAIKGIQSTSGAKVVFFSFEDEQWKTPGQFGVEQHWGCGSVFN